MTTNNRPYLYLDSHCVRVESFAIASEMLANLSGPNYHDDAALRRAQRAELWHLVGPARWVLVMVYVREGARWVMSDDPRKGVELDGDAATGTPPGPRETLIISEEDLREARAQVTGADAYDAGQQMPGELPRPSGRYISAAVTHAVAGRHIRCRVMGAKDEQEDVLCTVWCHTEQEVERLARLLGIPYTREGKIHTLLRCVAGTPDASNLLWTTSDGSSTRYVERGTLVKGVQAGSRYAEDVAVPIETLPVRPWPSMAHQADPQWEVVPAASEPAPASSTPAPADTIPGPEAISTLLSHALAR